MIKKFALLFLLGTILASTACKKDEPSKTENNKDLIEGEWTLVEYSAKDGTSTVTVNGSVVQSSTFSWEATDIDDCKVNFKSDGTYTSSGSMTLKTTTISGGQVIETSPALNFNTDGTWSIDGDELTSKDNTSMETAVGKILVLDDHNLRTEVDATFTRDIGGSTQVSSQTVTAVYTR